MSAPVFLFFCFLFFSWLKRASFAPAKVALPKMCVFRKNVLCVAFALTVSGAGGGQNRHNKNIINPFSCLFCPPTASATAKSKGISSHRTPARESPGNSPGPGSPAKPSHRTPARESPGNKSDEQPTKMQLIYRYSIMLEFAMRLTYRLARKEEKSLK